MAERHNYYREASASDGEAHPIDDELERRLRHGKLRKGIVAAQGRVIAALGEQRHLYLELEQVVGDRAIDREEAMFNIAFEHGLVRGRADSLRAALRRQGPRGRTLARQIARLAASEGLESPRALNVIIEVAWALSLGSHKPPVRAGRSRRAR